MDYNIENGGIPITNVRKKEEEIIVWTWEKGKLKAKKLPKITIVDAVCEHHDAPSRKKSL